MSLLQDYEICYYFWYVLITNKKFSVSSAAICADIPVTTLVKLRPINKSTGKVHEVYIVCRNEVTVVFAVARNTKISCYR